MGKKNIMIIVGVETCLRNWFKSGAFLELEKNYNVNVVLKYGWDLSDLEKYGINNYRLLSQKNWRKYLFLNFLSVTLFRNSRVANAFRIKTRYVALRRKIIYSMFSLPGIYSILHFLINNFMPIWGELSNLIDEIKPELIIMPSLAADAWTIDMILTAKKKKVKSFILINSWDNLVSKGIIPMAPDYLGVWGEQGVKQALSIQKIPSKKIVKLGAPRFDMYFDKKPENAKNEISEFNSIEKDKDIILFAATAMPFDDCGALQIIDAALNDEGRLSKYRVLYRPHPEMMPRKDEKHFKEYGFKNVFLDKQMEEFYNIRFKYKLKGFPSYINKTSLNYYPKLMNSIVGMVSTPTTLLLEAALNGIPILAICYNDGKNHYLSPEQHSQYENMREILDFPGVIPCYKEGDLLACLDKMIEYSFNENIKRDLVKATEYILYRDSRSYSERLSDFVDKII